MEEFDWPSMMVDYLAGIIPLREFYETFMVETWDVDDDRVHEIHLYFAEYTGGYRTEEDLQEKLAGLV